MNPHLMCGPPSLIAPGLWQGGCPLEPQYLKDQGIDVLVLSAIEFQPTQDELAMFPGVDVILAPMEDEDSGPALHEILIANKASDKVVEALKANKTVLCTCAAGRNRSSLISALALIKMYGMSGTAAAAHIRASRANTLTNLGFSAFLDRLAP
jgi:hypothetical protein